MGTFTRRIGSIQSLPDVMNRIKFSACFQGQFQWADSMGVSSDAGGNFTAGTKKRFIIRCGRLKVKYNTPVADKDISTSQYFYQIDVSEKGLAIRDFYAKFTDLWTGWFSLTAAKHHHPFGFEIGYSSSSQESPELGRMSQILFRNDRDLGCLLTIQGPKFTNWNWLKLHAGMFNGSGAPNTQENTSDFDKYKYFIRHFTISCSNWSEKIMFGVGVSYYSGGFRLDNDSVFIAGNDSKGNKGFVLENKNFKGNELKRKCYGIDAQVNIECFPGITTIVGEYIEGDQPNTSSSTVCPFDTVTSNGYYRNFNGANFSFLKYFVQTPFQAVLKCDWYDPNAKVKGDEIDMNTYN